MKGPPVYSIRPWNLTSFVASSQSFLPWVTLRCEDWLSALLVYSTHYSGAAKSRRPFQSLSGVRTLLQAVTSCLSCRESENRIYAYFVAFCMAVVPLMRQTVLCFLLIMSSMWCAVCLMHKSFHSALPSWSRPNAIWQHIQVTRNCWPERQTSLSSCLRWLSSLHAC